MKHDVTQSQADPDDSFTTLSIRRSAKAEYDHTAARLRLDLFEVAAVAVKALNSLPREKQERLIDSIRPISPAPTA